VSTSDVDRLARLLPSVHLLRDVRAGGALEGLLRVIGEQVEVLDDDIAKLYDNWFIETCEPWAVAYLGDLIGAAAGASRREVGAAIGARRRKGTLAILEELARDVGGWPARAVAFHELLAVAQSTKRPRLERGRTLDLRDGAALAALDGAFDTAAHAAGARHGIGRVGLYAWRLLPHTITCAPAYCLDRAPWRYEVSSLAHDVPLMTRPIDEPNATHVADELNVPAWIGRRAFADNLSDYYGPGQSLMLHEGTLDRPVAGSRIVAADLSDWGYEPEGDQVAVDPERGRIAFHPDCRPDGDVYVSYVAGFSADMGGGEYQRPLSPPAGRPVYTVGRGGTYARISEAIEAWQGQRRRDRGKASAIVEILDSDLYEDDGLSSIKLEADDRLELRAAVGARPHIRMGDRRGGRLDAMRVEGVPNHRKGSAPQVVLDGLLISGRAVRVSRWIGCVVIRHCTLVPGWSLESQCEPRTEEPSLIVDRARADSARERTTAPRVVIEHSILGGIRVEGTDEVRSDPFSVHVSDSILDATATSATALAGRGERFAHVELTLQRSTVIGRMLVHALVLAENSILDGIVRVARRQVGCVRYCSIVAGSRTPARYACVPEDVRPRFASRRYGRPDYCRLSHACPPEVARGADDESELGAFHDLFAPQRTAALQARLQEFSPAGGSVGLIFVT
jgi:hypothetical protein